MKPQIFRVGSHSSYRVTGGMIEMQWGKRRRYHLYNAFGTAPNLCLREVFWGTIAQAARYQSDGLTMMAKASEQAAVDLVAAVMALEVGEEP